MNKSVLLLALLSSPVFAENNSIYLGAGVGFGQLNSEHSVEFSDGVNVDPSSSSEIPRFFAGYKISAQWGVEFGYQYLSTDSGRSEYQGVNGGYNVDREWDAEIKSNQFSLKPVYYWDINKEWQLRTGLGLTYSQHTITGESYDEYEHQLQDDNEYNVKLDSESQNKNSWGVIGSVAIDYAIYKNWVVGVEATVFNDEIISGYQLSANILYRF